MKTGFNYKGATDSIRANIEKMENSMKIGRDQCLKIIGMTVKANVEGTIPRSEYTVRYLKKKGKVARVHMADDVIYKINTSKSGERYVSIRGDKTTGSLWHLVNDGHAAEDGTYVPGTFFIEKSLSQSDDEIDSIIDSFLEDIVSG